VIKCQNCGTENKDQWKFCLGCGSELPREQVAAAKRFATPTPPAGVRVPGGDPAAAAPMAAMAAPVPMAAPMAAMAAPVPMAAMAAPMPAPAPAAAPSPAAAPAPAAGGGPRACPACGNMVPMDNAFCGRCGHKMDAVPAPAAAPAPAPAPAAPMARGRLVLLQPDGSEGASVPLGDAPTQVGRSTHQVLAGDLFLSPVHMTFYFRDGQLVVRDEKSVNGLFFRLAPNVPVEMEYGDGVRLGQEYLALHALAPIVPDAGGSVAIGTERGDAWGRLDQLLGPGIVGNAYACRGERVVCGRERGHILFPYDGYVSGAHVEIRRQDGRMYITDLQSSNGTYLRVRGEKTLAPNEILLVGQYLYRVDY
jgi:pSer/pThr/pTyr-binding forkhead associated (FHA) protein